MITRKSISPEGIGREAPSMRRRILFVCTGNSARSQMAEAMVNAWWGEEWEAFSAGTEPAGFVHPTAIEVMGEIGLSLAGARSKSIGEVQAIAFDLVVTVCDGAAERCPTWPGQGRRVHLGFPNPAQAAGSESDVLAAFRQVRESIRRGLEELLGSRAKS